MDKLIKIGFSIFALTAVVFGFIRISNNLHLTFNTDGADSAASGEALLEETKQKITDTDTDGLSDWAELNTHGTSPYLADSDSDGISDSEEIKSSTDPNCPKGKNCGTGDLPATAAGVSSVDEEIAGGGVAPSAPTSEEVNNLSPDEIRALLKQGGTTDEQLQNVSDEGLKNLLDEVIQQQAMAQ
ncbi:MAG: hypothetical protein AAB779_01250 [Patescibacteria group bacterium]